MQQAKNLAEVITEDPQMLMPAYPRVPEDFVKIWHNQQTLIVFGGVGDIILRGGSVHSLLPQLIPLLNGKLPIGEIVKRVQGFRPGGVEDALSLLYMQGLLEEGPLLNGSVSRELVRDFSAQLKFYSRYIDYSRASRNRYEVLTKLQASRVLAFGAGAGAQQSLRELISLGLGHVSYLSLDGHRASASGLAAPHVRIETPELDIDALLGGDPYERSRLVALVEGQQIILLVSDQPCYRLTRILNQLSLDSKVPFLRSRIGPDCVEIGPTVYQNQSGCYECAHLQGLLALDACDEEAPEPLSNSAALSPEERIGASQTALAVLSILTTLVSITSGDVIYRISPGTLALEAEPVHKLAGCPVCAQIAGYEQNRDLLVGPDHVENWPTLYHFNTNERRYNIFPKGHQMHYSPKNMAMVSGAYKQYNNRETIPLPTSEMLPPLFYESFSKLAQTNRTPCRDSALTLTDLSVLLGIAAGFKVFEPRKGWQIGMRVTPSAGGMASQTLYAVNFAIAELPAGVYHYNPHGSLEKLKLGEFRAALDRAIPGSERLSGQIPAALVITSAFGRVEAKYLNKTYRYILYDIGAMLHSIQIVSQMLGLQLWQTGHFYDDEVNELLDIRTTTELVLCVAYLVQPRSRTAG